MSIGQALTIIEYPASTTRAQQRIQKRTIIIIFADSVTSASVSSFHQIITIVTITPREFRQIHIEHNDQLKRYVPQGAKFTKGNHASGLRTHLLTLKLGFDTIQHKAQLER